MLDLGLKSDAGSSVRVDVGRGVGVERGVMVGASGVDVAVSAGAPVGPPVGDGVATGPPQAVRASRIRVNKEDQFNFRVFIIPPSLSEQDT